MKKLFLMVAMLFIVNGTLVAQEPTPATPEVEVKEERSVVVGGRLGRRLARAARRQDEDVIVTLRGPCDLVRGVGRYVIDTGCRMTNGACEIVKAPFTTPCRLPKARKFLYQRPIFIPGRLIPLNDCEQKENSPSDKPAAYMPARPRKDSPSIENDTNGQIVVARW